VNARPDTTELSRFAYTYDRRGRRTAMTAHYGTWTYTYDTLGQLTRAVLDATDPSVPDQDLAYEYDALGNRVRTVVNGLEEACDVNGLNQYQQVGDRLYTYDLEGNLTREDGPGGSTVYTYNDENRLVGVTCGGDTWEYTYDAFGNRVAVDENGAVTHYVIDPVGIGNVVGEYSHAGGLVARYAHAAGLVSRTAAGDTADYYTFDPMGNTSELTGPAGATRNAYAYQPFGQTILASQTVPNAFRFMGRFGILSDNTGLHSVRARQYDARTGRFVSMDPIGLSGGDLNLYRYAFNTPVNALDPLGFEGICVEPSESMVAALAKIYKDIEETRNYMSEQTYEYIQAVLESKRTKGGIIKTTIENYQNNPLTRIEIATVAINAARERLQRLEVEKHPLEQEIQKQKYCALNKDPVPEPESCPLKPQVHASIQIGGLAAGGEAVRRSASAASGMPSSCMPSEPCDEEKVPAIASKDPNQKLSVAGYGAANYWAADGLLSYRIDFENTESATAPAQFVTIRDPLSENLDLDTFELTELGFGSEIIVVPPGRKAYETVVRYDYSDGDYDFEVDVHIEAWLEGRTLAVNFMTLDPATGLPPPVEVGFLPPENLTGRGKGHVSFLSRPKAGLGSGTAIRNVATIQFDGSLKIDTNQANPTNPASATPDREALVTLDAVAPTSRVHALPAVVPSSGFVVTWSGQDDAGGSGIRSYTVYVSDNGAPAVPWLEDASETNGVFVGKAGHAYSFFVRAKDEVGHSEAEKTLAEATTSVGADATVTFNVAGGTFAGSVSNTVTVGLPYGVLPVPTRVNYVFAGWWTGPDGTGTQVTETTTVQEGTELHAKWTGGVSPPQDPDSGYLCDPSGEASLSTPGSYDGYFYASSAFGTGTATAVRGTLNVKVTKTEGALTAKAVLQRGSLSFSAKAWTATEADGTLRATLPGKGGETLDLHVRQDRIWGTLSGGSVGGRLELDGARNRFAEKGDAAAQALLNRYLGYYTVALPACDTLSLGSASAAPQGVGYLAVTVGKGGSAKIAGVLADGAKVTQSGRLVLFGGCGDAACVPFYVPLYSKQGWAGGLLWVAPDRGAVVTDRDLGWFVRWENPGKGPEGFRELLDACGGYYSGTPSLAAHYLFGAEAGEAVFRHAGGAEYPAVIPDGVAVTAAGMRMTMEKGVKPAKVSGGGDVWYEYAGVNPTSATLTFAARTGLLKGKFSLYYDYELNGAPQHKAVSVPYAGVLATVRDAAFGGLPAGLGHCLVPESDPALKAYKLKRSFPVWLEAE